MNRTMATLAAGALGVGAHYLASLSGETGEPILIGFFVFLQGKQKHNYQKNVIINIVENKINERKLT